VAKVQKEKQQAILAERNRDELQFLYVLLTDNGRKLPTIKKEVLVQAFASAAGQGYVNVLEKLLHLGADKLGRTKCRGETALHIAAAQGQAEVVGLLLKKDVPVDVKDENDRMPLHCAVSHGQLDTVQLLLQNKAPINAKTSEGLTPLHLAVVAGRLPVVDVLMRFGADVSISGGVPTGQTPLELAQSLGRGEIINRLRRSRDKR